jgi:hypothetical protein
VKIAAYMLAEKALWAVIEPFIPKVCEEWFEIAVFLLKLGALCSILTVCRCKDDTFLTRLHLAPDLSLNLTYPLL